MGDLKTRVVGGKGAFDVEILSHSIVRMWKVFEWRVSKGEAFVILAVRRQLVVGDVAFRALSDSDEDEPPD